MKFENNPFIEPIGKEDGINQFKALTERVNSLEKTLNDYNDSFHTKNLYVSNGGNVNLTNLKVEDTLGNESLMNTSPIQSENVVGYDENGNLIPIHAVYDTGEPIYTPQNAQFLGTDADRRLTSLTLYDYIVNSQNKFNTLMESATSVDGTTYKNILIVGGFGNGTNGEYEYTVDSDTSDANFNNANITCVKSAKIEITLDDVNTNNIKIFKNINSIKNLSITVGGTILNGNNVYLFSDSNIYDSYITHNTNSANFYIEKSVLKNVINKEYVHFKNCELNECETIQSSFEGCSSEKLYVSTNNSLLEKYSFNKCGIHLDIKKTHVSESDSVTINVASLTQTTLTCLDEQSRLKTLTINCDACDSSSEIIGNKEVLSPLTYSVGYDYIENDDDWIPLSTYKSRNDLGFNRYKNIPHEDLPQGVNAFVDVGDFALMPLYTSDSLSSSSINAYLSPTLSSDMQIRKWKDLSYNIGYTLGFTGDYPTSSTLFYKDLSFTSTITLYLDIIDELEFNPIQIMNIPNEIIINSNTVKQFVNIGEESSEILYTLNNLSDASSPATFEVFLTPFLTSTMRVKKWRDSSNNIGYTINSVNRIYYTDLSFTFVKNLDSDTAQQISFTPLEIPNNKNKYDVFVVTDSDVSIKVKKAFWTCVKND